MASLHHLTPEDAAALDADERVLLLALDRRNQHAARVRGRGAPVALFFPATDIAPNYHHKTPSPTGTAVEIDPTSGRLSSGGPVGPQPAATNHGGDNKETG